MNTEFTSFSDFKRRYPIRPNDETMLLGSGSYGKVVKVEDQLETEWVAIKISEVKGTDSKSLLEEVKLAQGIPRQTNIARYDACYRLETDTSLSDFAVMKYYRDGNLAALLKNEKLTPTQVYDITKGILLGLQHLHQNRIVHRDFKPANILISRDNEGKLIPKIADFGLSKLVGNEEIDNSDFDLSDGRGTPSYKAPEQIEGSRVSFNLDLWAFGVILYEIMVGEKPFQADSRSGSEQAVRRSIELKIMSVQLPNQIEQVAQPYRAIIKRCLVRDIHQRVRKVTELLDLLDNIPELLTSAEAAEKVGDYEQAKGLYEQVLRFSPSNATAIRGLASCIDKSRPAPAAVANEPTDAYVPKSAFALVSEPTDVFPSIKADKPIVASASIATETIRSQPMQSVPWRYAIPVMVALAAVGFYVINSHRADAPQKPGLNTAAIVSGGLPGASVPGTSISPPKGPLAGSAVDTRLISKLLAQARKAYYAKNFKEAATLASQGLQSVPTHHDLQQVRRLALDQLSGPSTTNDVLPLPLPSPTEPVAGPVAVTTPEPDPKAEAMAKKQEAQQDYDRLIDKGAAAILSGNNKSAAITAFTEAKQLADKYDLNTTKGKEKFAVYLGKASRIFENEDYDGAKQWYLLAQSLDNTAEVKAKIKFCNNQ